MCDVVLEGFAAQIDFDLKTKNNTIVRSRKSNQVVRPRLTLNFTLTSKLQRNLQKCIRNRIERKASQISK